MNKVLYQPTEEECQLIAETGKKVIRLLKQELGTDEYKTAYTLAHVLLGFQDSTSLDMIKFIKELEKHTR